MDHVRSNNMHIRSIGNTASNLNSKANCPTIQYIIFFNPVCLQFTSLIQITIPAGGFPHNYRRMLSGIYFMNIIEKAEMRTLLHAEWNGSTLYVMCTHGCVLYTAFGLQKVSIHVSILSVATNEFGWILLNLSTRKIDVFDRISTVHSCNKFIEIRSRTFLVFLAFSAIFSFFRYYKFATYLLVNHLEK